VSLFFLALKATTISFLDVCKQSPIRLPRSNTRQRWHYIDASFLDGAGSVSLLLLTWKAANTSFMNGCNQSPLGLHKMHSQKSLTLHWRSFSEWDNHRVVYSVAKKGCQYVGYGWQQPGHFWNTVLTRRKIVDARSTLIFRMRQDGCCYCFSLERQPVPCVWTAVTCHHFGYPRSTAKNCWPSIDPDFKNGAVMLSLTLWARKAASMLVMDSTEQVTFHLAYLQD